MGAGGFADLSSRYARLGTRTATAMPGTGLAISHDMSDKQYEKSPAPRREGEEKRDSAGEFKDYVVLRLRRR